MRIVFSNIKFEKINTLNISEIPEKSSLSLRYSNYHEEENEDVIYDLDMDKVLIDGYSTKFYFAYLDELELFYEHKCSFIKNEILMLDFDLGIIQLPNYLSEYLGLGLVFKEYDLVLEEA